MKITINNQNIFAWIACLIEIWYLRILIFDWNRAVTLFTDCNNCSSACDMIGAFFFFWTIMNIIVGFLLLLFIIVSLIDGDISFSFTIYESRKSPQEKDKQNK